MDNIMTEKLWTFDARGTNDPLTQCLEALTSVGMLSDVEAGRASVLEREEDGTTYVGRNTALPHVVGNAALHPGFMAAPCDPIDWGGLKVSFLIFFIVPEGHDFDTSQLADIMQKIVAVGIEAANVPLAHQQTLKLFHELGATHIERNQRTWL